MNTLTCRGCAKEFPEAMVVDGQRVILSKRAFCLECSPYKQYRHNGRKKKDVVEGRRECPVCRTWKPLAEFRLRKRNDRDSTYLCSLCDSCEVERQREAAQNRAQRRNQLKQKAVDYLGGKCELCGYDRCLGSLHFHHKDPKQKDFCIGTCKTTYGWDRTQQELDKCFLVCANCHGEIHWKRSKEGKE